MVENSLKDLQIMRFYLLKDDRNFIVDRNYYN